MVVSMMKQRSWIFLILAIFLSYTSGCIDKKNIYFYSMRGSQIFIVIIDKTKVIFHSASRKDSVYLSEDIVIKDDNIIKTLRMHLKPIANDSYMFSLDGVEFIIQPIVSNTEKVLSILNRFKDKEIDAESYYELRLLFQGASEG